MNDRTNDLFSATTPTGATIVSGPAATDPEAREEDDHSTWSKGELYEKARELDIPGRSLFTKKHLLKAIRSCLQERSAPPALPIAWLTCNLHPSIPLYEDKTLTLGRSSDCDVTLPQKAISRFHAEIRVEGGTISLSDSGSQNGVHLNGKRVTCATLEFSDVVTLGAYDLELCRTGCEDLENTSLIERTRRGLISQEPLQDVLQDLDLNKRSAVLTVLSGDIRGRLIVIAGEPVTADLEELRDEAAVLAMLALTEGRFLLSERHESALRTMRSSLTGILLRHLCRQDQVLHEQATQA